LLLVSTPAQAEPSHIKLSPSAGTWHVPVEVDGALTAPFMVDSGAAIVVLTADMYARLRSLGAIRDEDLRPPQSFTMADGAVHQWPTFMLRSLKVGGVTIENVHGAAKPTSMGSALLGQPFLERLKAWHVDNSVHELVLEPREVPRAVAVEPYVVPRMVDAPVAPPPPVVMTERIVVQRQPVDWIPPSFQVQFWTRK
jgi:clan AA aspartic protease (TIGR02281 family)